MPQILTSPKYLIAREDFDDEYEEITVKFFVNNDFSKGGSDLFFDPIDTPKSASAKAGFEIDEEEFHGEWSRIQNECGGPGQVTKKTIDDADAVAEKQEAAKPAPVVRAPARQTQIPVDEISFEDEESVVEEEGPQEEEKIGI